MVLESNRVSIWCSSSGCCCCSLSWYCCCCASCSATCVCCCYCCVCCCCCCCAYCCCCYVYCCGCCRCCCCVLLCGESLRDVCVWYDAQRQELPLLLPQSPHHQSYRHKVPSPCPCCPMSYRQCPCWWHQCWSRQHQWNHRRIHHRCYHLRPRQRWPPGRGRRGAESVNWTSSWIVVLSNFTENLSMLSTPAGGFIVEQIWGKHTRCLYNLWYQNMLPLTTTMAQH